MRDTVISRYECCSRCSDGSCRRCGPRSAERAGPGVVLVQRRVRFVRCGCSTGGCIMCGANSHERAAPGVRIEVVEERALKRWVPSVHLRTEKGGARCGTRLVDPKRSASDNIHEVNCPRCVRLAAFADLRRKKGECEP